MKQVILLMVMFVLVGCNSIAHKGFITVNHVKGGDLTSSVDPKSGTITPKVFAGQYTNVLVTVPYGTKVKGKVTTWNWFVFWEDRKSLEIDLDIDATSDAVTEDVIKESIKRITKD